MSFLTEHADFIVHKYFDEEQSIKKIADLLGTYPNKIRRTLIALGYELRDKSEAQKINLRENPEAHPTKGKTRSEEVKEKIGDSVAENWQSLTEEERKQRSDVQKENWNKMSLDEQRVLRNKAAQAVRKTTIEGSRAEKFIKDYLTNEGYSVIIHKRVWVADTQLEIDVYIPAINLAIEVNGPRHYLPINGAGALARQKTADVRKAGILKSGKVKLIVVQQLNKNISQKYLRNLCDVLYPYIEDIENCPDYVELKEGENGHHQS